MMIEYLAAPLVLTGSPPVLTCRLWHFRQNRWFNLGQQVVGYGFENIIWIGLHELMQVIALLGQFLAGQSCQRIDVIQIIRPVRKRLNRCAFAQHIEQGLDTVGRHRRKTGLISFTRQ